MEGRMRELAKKIRFISDEREYIESQAVTMKEEYDKLMKEFAAFKKAYNLTVIMLNKYQL